LRGSSPVLRGPWGETPQGYSPIAQIAQNCMGDMGGYATGEMWIPMAAIFLKAAALIGTPIIIHNNAFMLFLPIWLAIENMKI